MRAAAALIGLLVIAPGLAHAETVLVKYRGPVDLSPFACEGVSRSSLVHRVCYDAPNQYMIISLKGSYHHYCRVGPDTIQALMAADSMGRYYNTYIRGQFDCRLGGVPVYQ